MRSHVFLPSVALASGILWCSATPYSLNADAEREEILSAARECAELDWRDKAGKERTQAYREAVDCHKLLYVRIAGSASSNAAFEEELSRRLDSLEEAYRESRNICRLREELEIGDGGGCGTISLSSHEFVLLLKTMILAEDAGWVREDPALAKALQLAGYD